MTSQNQQELAMTIPNYEVHCSNCGWWGYMSQLKIIDVLIEPDDISSEPGCPGCLMGWLEFRDNSIEEAVTNLALASKQFKESMENLHCQISLRQS